MPLGLLPVPTPWLGKSRGQQWRSPQPPRWLEPGAGQGGWEDAPALGRLPPGCPLGPCKQQQQQGPPPARPEGRGRGATAAAGGARRPPRPAGATRDLGRVPPAAPSVAAEPGCREPPAAAAVRSPSANLRARQPLSRGRSPAQAASRTQSRWLPMLDAAGALAASCSARRARGSSRCRCSPRRARARASAPRPPRSISGSGGAGQPAPPAAAPCRPRSTQAGHSRLAPTGLGGGGGEKVQPLSSAPCLLWMLPVACQLEGSLA